MGMSMSVLKCCAFYEFSGFKKEVIYTSKTPYDPPMAVGANFDEKAHLKFILDAYKTGKDVYVEGDLKDLMSSRFKPFVIFTEQVASGSMGSFPEWKLYGTRLANYITEHGLGSIVKTEPEMNWTGYRIRGFVWTPNWNGLAMHLGETLL